MVTFKDLIILILIKQVFFTFFELLFDIIKAVNPSCPRLPEGTAGSAVAGLNHAKTITKA